MIHDPASRQASVRQRQLTMAATAMRAHGSIDRGAIVSELVDAGWLDGPMDALRWVASLDLPPAA